MCFIILKLKAKKYFILGPSTTFCFELIGLLWNPTYSACSHSLRFDSIPDGSVLVASSRFNSH